MNTAPKQLDSAPDVFDTGSAQLDSPPNVFADIELKQLDSSPTLLNTKPGLKMITDAATGKRIPECLAIARRLGVDGCPAFGRGCCAECDECGTEHCPNEEAVHAALFPEPEKEK